MGSDDEILDSRVAREADSNRNGSSVSASTLIEDVGDGLCRESVSAMGFCQGSVELACPVLIEQPEEARGGATQMAAVKRDRGEEWLCGRARREQAVTSAMVARLSLVGAERREVSLVLDLLADAPGASVTSDLNLAIEHTHDGLGGDERERLFDQGVGDRVVIFVEA